MRKPKEPFKPYKPTPPQEMIQVPIELCLKEGYNIPLSEILEYNKEKLKNWDGDLSKITIDYDKGYEGDHIEIYCGYEERKNPHYKEQLANYKRDLKKYNKDILEYESKLAKYNQDMVPYNEWKRQNEERAKKAQISALEKQLAKLKGQ